MLLSSHRTLQHVSEIKQRDRRFNAAPPGSGGNVGLLHHGVYIRFWRHTRRSAPTMDNSSPTRPERVGASLCPEHEKSVPQPVTQARLGSQYKLELRARATVRPSQESKGTEWRKPESGGRTRRRLTIGRDSSKIEMPSSMARPNSEPTAATLRHSSARRICITPLTLIRYIRGALPEGLPRSPENRRPN